MLILTLTVGFNWPAASLFARPALLRSRFLLLDRYGAPGHPVDIAQEVQDRSPEIREYPPDFHLAVFDATRNAAQLCALGSRLLRVQLPHPSPLL